MDPDEHPDPWQAFHTRAEAFGLGDHCAF
jgi:hypothetical protein